MFNEAMLQETFHPSLGNVMIMLCIFKKNAWVWTEKSVVKNSVSQVLFYLLLLFHD